MMFVMRYPNLPFEIDSDETTEQHHFEDNAENSVQRKYINPSVSGLAFASCAAALPLMRNRDPISCSKVLTLFQSGLQYMFEPGPGPEAERWSDTEKNRLKHLLRRTEQVGIISYGLLSKSTCYACNLLVTIVSLLFCLSNRLFFP